jgi:hypothetical protein
MKLDYEKMEMLYQLALESATKTLFEDHFKEHGWTKEDFITASVEYANALADGRVQRWLN